MNLCLYNKYQKVNNSYPQQHQRLICTSNMFCIRNLLQLQQVHTNKKNLLDDYGIQNIKTN